MFSGWVGSVEVEHWLKMGYLTYLTKAILLIFIARLFLLFNTLSLLVLSKLFKLFWKKKLM